MESVVAGVDIGGTNTVFGIVSSEGNILARDTISTNDHKGPEELIHIVSNKIKELLNNLRTQIPSLHLAGVGIGAPNGNFFRGTIEFAPNLKWKGVVPVAEWFEKELSVPALLTNDANAAAIGEMIFGGARNMQDFLFITLGTGLGSGIVVNGEVVYGHDGFAGEIGHVVMDLKGRICGCGRKGCLETYCSATGIVKTYQELNPSASKETDARIIFEKALAGEKEANEAFRLTGEMLGLALANSVAYTSPQAIFLFGGLAQAGEILFKPVRESFERNLLMIYKQKVQILPSRLRESDAAILGSASLIYKMLEKSS
jgi:glucokinase